MLYFAYSMWQSNVLSVIKNFLNIHSSPLNIPILPTLTIHYIESGQTGFVLTSYCLIQHWKGWEKSFESFQVLCHMLIRFYKWIIIIYSTVHTSQCNMNSIILFSPLILPRKVLYMYSMYIIISISMSLFEI